ncbi:MAG TPA: prepilin-type N-terminal cleavage/methylation domain-containing protein [Nitrospiria bacterium]|nr:prepilin-type N-terminal cleavage/methylation domain-containing protein [Nitrospiria bacterium]
MAGKDGNGFTLIELVLTILIVLILGAVVSLSLSSLSDSRLDQAVNKVVGDLRYAQQLAVSTQSRHGITITSTAGYTIYRDASPNPDVPVADPSSLGATLVVNFDAYRQGQLSGVRFSSATPFCGGAGGVMEFNSIGAPTDTNGTVLTCTSSVILNYSGRNRVITIQQNTGNLTH